MSVETKYTPKEAEQRTKDFLFSLLTDEQNAILLRYFSTTQHETAEIEKFSTSSKIALYIGF